MATAGDSLLHDLYYGDHPTTQLANQLILYKAAKKIDPTITHAKVKKFLQKQLVYEKYLQPSTRSKVKKGQSKRYILISAPKVEYALDSMYLKQTGSNFENALVCIDLFSKMLYFQFMRTVSSKSALIAFKKMISDIGQNPEMIYTDAGVEWKAEFAKFLKDQNIKHVFANKLSPHHTAIGERIIKEIRLKAAKLRELKYSPNEALKRAVLNHNSSFSTSIGMSPSEASDIKRAGDVLLHVQRNRARQRNKIGFVPIKFRVGQHVRMRTLKTQDARGHFTKIGRPTVTGEVFKITSIVYTEPEVSYKLANWQEVALPGSYLQSSLVPAIATVAATPLPK